ncbi:MAG: serine/threonine-protein kinase [Myxococcota bacterium]
MTHAVPARPSIHDLSGTELDGRYRLVRLVGAGGMGSVYEGLHIVLGTQVAIKVLKPDLCADEKFHRRFLREARAASAIRSKHVVRATDFGRTAEGLVYFVMDLLEGRDLDIVLRTIGRMSWPKFRPIALQLIDALGAAHEEAIVHRDIKPANVFLVHRPGEPVLVKVLDFGIAKIAADGTDGLTGTDEIFGTVSYMAPELAEGIAATTQSDMYSLGVLMYRALTGRLPFADGTPFQILAKHLHEMPPPPRRLVPQIPMAVESTILDLMAKKPHLRPSTWNELLERLRAAPDDDSTATPPCAPAPNRSTRPAPSTGLEDTEFVPVQAPHAVVTAPALERPVVSVDVAHPGVHLPSHGTEAGPGPRPRPRPRTRTGTLPSITVRPVTGRNLVVPAASGSDPRIDPRTGRPRVNAVVSGEINPTQSHEPRNDLHDPAFAFSSVPEALEALEAPEAPDQFEQKIRSRRRFMLTVGVGLVASLVLALGLAIWRDASADSEDSGRELLYQASPPASAEPRRDPSEAMPSQPAVSDQDAQASIRREIARRCEREGSRYLIKGDVEDEHMQKPRLVGFDDDRARTCAAEIVKATRFPEGARRTLSFSL